MFFNILKMILDEFLYQLLNKFYVEMLRASKVKHKLNINN